MAPSGQELARRLVEVCHIDPAYRSWITVTLSSALSRARAEAMEEAAKSCEREADACLNDIVEGDEEGTKIARYRASALLTQARDIRALSQSRPESEVKS